jgi:hypothetical protein
MQFAQHGKAPPSQDLIGLPTLAQWAFEGRDLGPVWNMLVHRVKADPADAAGLLDLSTIAQLQGRPSHRHALQAEALSVRRIFRQSTTLSEPALTVLAFVAPGSFMANLPVEFLLAGSDIELQMAYIVPGSPMIEPFPAHDVALVAVAESDENQDVLRTIAQLIGNWPRPVINAPDRIARLTRDGTWNLLKSLPGVMMPQNARVQRKRLSDLACGTLAVEDLLGGSAFPIVVRPRASHAGDGLVKLDQPGAINPYLDQRPEDEFFLAPFIDYRSEDGLFRKYRVALIDGQPHACHMAISDHWMIHYLNAGMTSSAVKRAEEARFMSEFASAFGARHAAAFEAIAAAAGLEYLPIDCGEAPDGRLLLFESGTNMIVHAMDSAELFPYKRVQMARVFNAFQAMLRRHARHAGRTAHAAHRRRHSSYLVGRPHRTSEDAATSVAAEGSATLLNRG